MPEVTSALQGARFEGYVTVAEAPLQGMITLRGDLDDDRLIAAVTEVTGVAMPGLRGIETGPQTGIAWMSPDELLVLVPYEKAAAMAADLSARLSERHALVVNVSDARAMLTLTGPALREVIAKLAPVDMAPGRIAPGEMRRTRMAQVPAAFWMTSDSVANVICFRSVAQYVFDLLSQAAEPGGEVGIFA